jgi:hypothetical protein
MGIAQDLVDRLRSLQTDRLPWEEMWYDVARYTLPDAERFDGMFAGRDRGSAIDTVVAEPIAARRSKDVYDQTSLWAIDRLVAGILSLTTPQSEYWHGLETDDPLGVEATDEEERFFERMRDYLFAIRDNPVSGFWVAHKAALRSTCAFGTGVMYTEESGKGVSSPIAYRYVPTSENHLSCDYNGIVDCNYRLFRRSAAQCVQRWGDKTSAKTREWANDPKQKDRTVLLLHAVAPRRERGSAASGVRGSSRWASYYVEVDEKHLIGDSGYFEFPYIVYHWQRNNAGPYAEGPLSLALADVKSLNMLAKSALLAAQLAVKPAYGLPDDGINRLNLNPGAMNVGAVNRQGQLLAQPLNSGTRPDFAETILEAKRNQVRETLYVNLWQILVSNPQMTATEAMLRANEKGELLGPVGGSIHLSMANMIDREVAIVERNGAFMDGSPIRPPASMAGRNIGVRFSSPLDRMRRSNQAVAIERMWAVAGQLAMAQANAGEPPTALDRLDADMSLDELQEIYGAPKKIMRTDDDVAALRQQRQQAMQAAQGIQGVAGAGQAAQQAAAGIDAVANSPAGSELLRGLLSQAGAA